MWWISLLFLIVTRSILVKSSITMNDHNDILVIAEALEKVFNSFNCDIASLNIDVVFGLSITQSK